MNVSRNNPLTHELTSADGKRGPVFFTGGWWDMTESRGHDHPRVIAASSRRGDAKHERNIVLTVEDLLDGLSGNVEPSAGVLLDIRRGRLRCLVVREQVAVLSPRELEIARMVAQGHPTKRIARSLDISQFTVNSHLRRIFVKLGVTTRAAMVAQLPRHGILDFAEYPDGSDESEPFSPL